MRELGTRMALGTVARRVPAYPAYRAGLRGPLLLREE